MSVLCFHYLCCHSFRTFSAAARPSDTDIDAPAKSLLWSLYLCDRQLRFLVLYCTIPCYPALRCIALRRIMSIGLAIGCMNFSFVLKGLGSVAASSGAPCIAGGGTVLGASSGAEFLQTQTLSRLSNRPEVTSASSAPSLAPARYVGHGWTATPIGSQTLMKPYSINFGKPFRHSKPFERCFSCRTSALVSVRPSVERTDGSE